MSHATYAEEFNTNEKNVDWHDETLWFVRNKRDASSQTLPEWESLRELASSVKSNVLANLDDYLQEFEQQAEAHGIRVHWAKDAEEHNQIVYRIIEQHNARRVVKSKSMLTEECHLNPYLEARGVEVIDTDLGERIVQLSGQTPSHIVMPAIHMKKSEIGELFHRTMGTPEGMDDPQYLTGVARERLRQKFLEADVAITGVNFAIAETGGFVVCTNEGNADMGVHTASVHIACMGIEKLIPKVEHLGVFLRLLARSATGQPITVYSSHFHQPRPGGELHVVLVDNGRTELLGKPDFRRSLHCIRCGACMNTCPIYRRSGGHSYDATIPGPIGSILSPNLDMKKHSSLPFASTLCGSCSNVCPVKIDIHTQLYKWRQVIAKEGHLPAAKGISMRAAGWLFAHPRLYRWVGWFGRKVLSIVPRSILYHSANVWGRGRELPTPPPQSFREWYLKQPKNGKQ